MQEKIKALRKKIRKNKWLSFLIDTVSTLLMFAIAAGIGVFVAFGQHAGNAGNYAQRYFEAYITQNWQGMYDVIDIKESEFVNYESFERMMEGRIIYGEFDDTEINVTKKNGNTAYVEINYKDDSGNNQILSVKMKKQDEKVYKFFKTWKVDGESLVVKNCKINIPTGTVVTLDAKDISSYHTNSSEGKELYVVDRLFAGEHDFGISTVYIDAYSDTKYVEEDGFSYNVEKTDFKMKEEDKEYLTDATTKLVFGMYNNALNDLGVEDLMTYFGSDADNLALLESCYDEMYNDINKEDGSMLKTMEIESYSSYVFNYSYPSRVETRIDFNCSYTAKTGRSYASAVRGTYENTGMSTCKICFALTDEGWVIDELDVKCIDYKPTDEYLNRPQY